MLRLELPIVLVQSNLLTASVGGWSTPRTTLEGDGAVVDDDNCGYNDNDEEEQREQDATAALPLTRRRGGNCEEASCSRGGPWGKRFGEKMMMMVMMMTMMMMMMMTMIPTFTLKRPVQPL